MTKPEKPANYAWQVPVRLSSEYSPSIGRSVPAIEARARGRAAVVAGRTSYLCAHITPNASIASATLTNPAMLAPFT